MYKHQDNKDSLFTLHDCKAEKMSFQDGTLSFYFPDGFWVLEKHPGNEFHTTVKSDAAKVDFHTLDETVDDISIYIFTQAEAGKALREDWKPRHFIHAVNSGLFQVEFITLYKSYQSLLYKCWIWLQKEPYHKECDIIISTDAVTYCWNNLCKDRVW